MLKFAFVILVGLLALAVGSANPTSLPQGASQTAQVEPVPITGLDAADLIVEERSASEVELVSQPTPAKEPDKAEPPKAEPETGSPSDRVIPPPAVAVETKCGSEPTCCARKARCCKRVSRCCRSGCGLFRRR